MAQEEIIAIMVFTAIVVALCWIDKHLDNDEK